MNQNVYLALGDSITTGYGVGVNHSFASLYYSKLQVNFPGIKYVNLGVNGLTSEELATLVRQGRIHSLINQAGVITITMGSNDLLDIGKGLLSGAGANVDLSLANLKHSLMFIGHSIRSVNPTAVVKIATIYNPLPPMNRQFEALARGLVKKANRAIVHIAREYGFVVIPVDKAFSGRESSLLATDHLHPNRLGHNILAELFSR